MNSVQKSDTSFPARQAHQHRITRQPDDVDGHHGELFSPTTVRWLRSAQRRHPHRVVWGSFGSVCGVLLLLTALVTGQQPSPSPASDQEASISLLKVGTVEVAGGQRITLEQPVADLFGSAWNYREQEFFALIRPQGGQRWYVAGSSQSQPGGIFHIPGVIFPHAGDFEMVVAMRQPNALPVRAWIEEKAWRKPVPAPPMMADSERVLVTILAPLSKEVDSGEGDFFIAILSVGNVSVRPREIRPVPTSGDVVVQTRGLPQEAKLFLAVHVPYTDRCYIHGPAARDQLPNLHTFHSISFQTPGDPQQLYLDLVAFASTRPYPIGLVSWQSFRQATRLVSPTVEILIDSKRLRTDSLRVPFIAITNIGGEKITGEEEPMIDQGAELEVSGYERVPEGALLWALTRPKGSNVWLAQGPLLPRGISLLSDAEAVTVGTQPRRLPLPRSTPTSGPAKSRHLVKWVWPNLWFARPDDQQSEVGEREYEVMAVLSSALLPNAWVASTYLSTQAVETVSQIVSVSLNPKAMKVELHPTITRVSGKDADSESETVVGVTGNVEISTPENFPTAFKIYLGKHLVGASTWSFVEAIRQGKSYFVPDLSFTNPHAQEGTRYQLLALVANGPLPTREMEYQDFLSHAVAVSEVVTTRYRQESVWNLFDALFFWLPNLPSPTPPPTSTPPSSGNGSYSVWPFLPWLGILALLVLLIYLVRRLFKPRPELAGKVADTLQRGCALARQRFSSPPEINPGYFILGIVILLLVLYVLQRYYIRLYTEAVATVTGLPARESAGLAVWLILITALVGIFLDLSNKFSQAPAATPMTTNSGTSRRHTTLTLGLGGIGVILWSFQAGIYYSFIRQKVGENEDALLPALGAMAAFVISMAETVAFFFITELTLAPLGWFAVLILLAPFSLLALFFRFIQHLFEHQLTDPRYGAPPNNPTMTGKGQDQP